MKHFVTLSIRNHIIYEISKIAEDETDDPADMYRFDLYTQVALQIPSSRLIRDRIELEINKLIN